MDHSFPSTVSCHITLCTVPTSYEVEQSKCNQNYPCMLFHFTISIHWSYVNICCIIRKV